MTTYDASDIRSDMDPAYRIHHHDPRMMEYMGALESAAFSAELQNIGWSTWGGIGHWRRHYSYNHDERPNSGTVCYQPEQDGVGNDAGGVRPGAFPTEAVQFVTPAHRVLSSVYLTICDTM